ncbi:glutamate--cysteine ligase [Amycolatopsis marina]|uniref:Glutamate--cysteine ligase EgtA n=1 Tax=Amycolatopsis marina TaxID=490629 RepID=A0A1I1C558_9PSEU|nr:glutamate-cysteine ligase family protein [Amycolatopsis marina]SFB57795.1 glutamate--cysteine ligase [Amycolatopsis marina]
MTAVHAHFPDAERTGRADAAAVNRTARVLADRAEGEAYVASVCFKHGPPRLLGAELEYTVHHIADPARPLDPDVIADALGPHTPRTLRRDSPAQPLPAGSPLSLEPGCQVEISALPQPSLAALSVAISTDLDYLTELLARHGLCLGTQGIDAHRLPQRLLNTERYAAMERRFAPIGPGGITMMCSTAGLQVCLDTGERDELPARWAALHALGPVLLALFANSARHAGRETGSVSARWLAVMGTERARTYAARVGPRFADPATGWAARIMDTPLLVLPRTAAPWDAPDGLTFGDWIDGRGAGEALDPPTTDDLDYHLTTMFTPVRPRGYLEARYLDAQPPGEWLTPVALLTALLSRKSVVDSVLEACLPVAQLWEPAARHGLAVAELATAARRVADIGCAALPETGLPPETVSRLESAVYRRLHRARKD